MAFDSRGAEAAGPWIEQANPTYPALIDPHHRVAELYNMVNVPQAVWIDEEGRIVRPTETAGTGDEFRSMMKEGGIPPDDLQRMMERRRLYGEAVKDWVRHGPESRFVLAPDDARRRVKPVAEEHVLAAAAFRLGQHLRQAGHVAEGDRFLGQARGLRPESWAYRRQSWNLEAPGDERSGGPPFWEAVDALGDDWYYEPVDMPGLP